MTCSYPALKILQNWQLIQSRTVLSTISGLGVKVLAVAGWRAHAGAVEKQEEEEAVDRSYYELTRTPSASPPVLCGGGTSQK